MARPPTQPSPRTPVTPRPPTRLQRRWSGRLRTSGALLLLAGTVALLDRVLPHSSDPVLGRVPGLWQLGCSFIAVGGVCFWLGRRWGERSARR